MSEQESLPLPRPPVSEWKPGDSVKGYVYLSDVQKRTSGSSTRWTARAQDATGSIDAVDWDGNMRDMPAAGFAAISGTVESYRDKPQLKVLACRVARAEVDAKHGFDEALCIPSAPERREDLWSELLVQIDRLGDPAANRCAKLCLERYGDRLAVWPAAQKLHHAYRSGLLQHVVGMLRYLSPLTVESAGADYETVALGVLFHDLGKIEELGPMPGDPLTVRGLSEGHITISAAMWQEIAAEAGAPEALRGHILHLILSHHGRKEYGSPVEPMTREAHLLHLIDMIDSRIEMIRAATVDAPVGQAVECYPLGRVLGSWPNLLAHKNTEDEPPDPVDPEGF